jgi:ADP-ribose pyrophosphatase YjhB (NUDIX family)
MDSSNIQISPSNNDIKISPKISLTGESDLRYIDNPIGSIFVGLIARRDNKLFAILEDKKLKWRFIGGKVEEQDDAKGVLPVLSEKGGIGVNYQDLVALTRTAIKRETLEESGNVINPERAKFVCAFLNNDEKNPGKLHLQIFLEYKLKENEEWKFNPQQPSTEDEKAVNSAWVEINYDAETKRIRLNPFIKMSRSHFAAALQFARNR